MIVCVPGIRTRNNQAATGGGLPCACVTGSNASTADLAARLLVHWIHFWASCSKDTREAGSVALAASLRHSAAADALDSRA
jgi:hypothetical protein